MIPFLKKKKRHNFISTTYGSAYIPVDLRLFSLVLLWDKQFYMLKYTHKIKWMYSTDLWINCYKHLDCVSRDKPLHSNGQQCKSHQQCGPHGRMHMEKSSSSTEMLKMRPSVPQTAPYWFLPTQPAIGPSTTHQAHTCIKHHLWRLFIYIKHEKVKPESPRLSFFLNTKEAIFLNYWLYPFFCVLCASCLLFKFTFWKLLKQIVFCPKVHMTSLNVAIVIFSK